MYRTYLSTLVLGFVLAVLAAALPATNDKRQGIDGMLDEMAHVRPDIPLQTIHGQIHH